MNSPRPSFRHQIEFAVFKFIVTILKAIPPHACRSLAHAIGTIGFATMNRRRDVACANIRLAKITPDETEVRKIARASMTHFAYVALTALQNAGSDDQVDTEIIQDIDPLAKAAMQDPRQGVILCAGHLGNWEIGLQTVAKSYPLLGIARRMNNPLVDDFLHCRQNRNVEITPKHDADAGRLLRALASGRNLALLFDQHASNHRGISVPFFGVPASTYASPAMLHLTTKAPLCFCSCIKSGPNQYHLKIEAPIQYERTGRRKDDTIAILMQLNTKLEEAIRQHPEQYLWGHRRWRDH